MLVLYCFLMMVLLPFCLYLLIVLCIRVCSDEKHKLTLRETLADAFCCKRETICCCKCEEEEIQEKKENKEKEEEWPEYIAKNFDQQGKDIEKLPENNQTIKDHESKAGDEKLKEDGPKDQSNQQLNQIKLPEIDKKKGILKTPSFDSLEEIDQPQHDDSVKREEQKGLQSKEDKKQTEIKSEGENVKSASKTSSKENGFHNMNKKLHDSSPDVEEDMDDGEDFDQIAKVIDNSTSLRKKP
ncbi:UNKNOWN [Stylonychia lemnae]|uniref:Uncharacterized protein n=1 Tax=Stylonychia lemnae TaxID=5949 RepID=A0A078AGM4_STYLE|nr:UNKNOWN [Stylonychia lemnae]|eukprot:CDW81430.1 UNKNOWN [Stylonychia lemnae]